MYYKKKVNNLYLLLFGFVVTAILAKAAISIVPPGSVGIVFRSGRFQSVMPNGLHFVAPFLDRTYILTVGQSGVMKSERLCDFLGIQAPVISGERERMRAGDPVRIEKIERDNIFVVSDITEAKP